MNAQTRRRRSYLWGIAAEYLCAGFLLCKGYRILKLRYRNRYGEIDIVAARGNTLVFMEIKARNSHESALHSITPAKREAVSRAASAFVAAQQKYSHTDLRFDVMVVTSGLRIHHLQNAWSIA